MRILSFDVYLLGIKIENISVIFFDYKFLAMQFSATTSYKAFHSLTCITGRPVLFESEALHCTHEQILFTLSIAIHRAEHACATVNIQHKYFMCHHKIRINMMLCLLNSTEQKYGKFAKIVC